MKLRVVAVVALVAAAISAGLYFESRVRVEEGQNELRVAEAMAATLQVDLARAVGEADDAEKEVEDLNDEVAELRESNDALAKQIDELETAARAQPLAPAFIDLSSFSASIRNFVRGAYLDNYCTSPSAGEVIAWTKRVIDHGNDLQRSPGLLAEAALEEAKAEIDFRMWSSPEAEFLRKGGAC